MRQSDGFVVIAANHGPGSDQGIKDGFVREKETGTSRIFRREKSIRAGTVVE
jgi:hypothetical protein